MIVIHVDLLGSIFYQGIDEMELARPDEKVHLGKLIQQLSPISLWQTATDDQTSAEPLPLVPRNPQDGIDGFFGGLSDETAGVDDYYLGSGFIRGDGIAAPRQEAQHYLRIDQILGTSKADHVYHRPHAYFPH